MRSLGTNTVHANALGVTMRLHWLSVPVSKAASSATCMRQSPAVLSPLKRDSCPTGSGPRFGMPNSDQMGLLNAGNQVLVNGASAEPLRFRSLADASSKTVLTKLSPSLSP